jgi:hypothetical protein
MLTEVADPCAFCVCRYGFRHSNSLGRSVTPYRSSYVFLEPGGPDGNSGSNGNYHKLLSFFLGPRYWEWVGAYDFILREARGARS